VARPAPLFENRSDAGRQLAASLTRYAGDAAVQVLGLPRGGVPVAFEVAEALKVPLRVFVVRKLGVPGQPELAFGALAGGGVRVLNADVVRRFKIGPEVVDMVVRREQRELARQQEAFKCAVLPCDIEHRIVILVDDGLATGATMRAAVAALRQMHPSRVVVAVPAGAMETCELVKQEANEMVCLAMPEPFEAVGLWYRDFSQVTDAEVRKLCAAT
jgi:putative phosphoribosyl transferase